MIKLRIIHIDNNNNVVSDRLDNFDVNISIIDKPFYVTYNNSDSLIRIQFFYGQNGEAIRHYNRNQFTMNYGLTSGRIYKATLSKGRTYNETDFYHFSNEARVNLTSLRGQDNIIEFLKIIKSISTI